MPLAVERFNVRVFCDGVKDGADAVDIERKYPFVLGFTTNPTIMRAMGIYDYERYVRDLKKATILPISFELVEAFDHVVMLRQAHKLASWGASYVKVPIIAPDGTSNVQVIKACGQEGISVNVTAVFTHQQIDDACEVLNPDIPGIISVFAGRIADTGIDPCEHIRYANVCSKPGHGVLWASTRGIFDIMQADDCGADIITVPPSMLPKVPLLGKNLHDFSVETSEMFARDAKQAGLTL
jgi:transaldolase